MKLGALVVVIGMAGAVVAQQPKAKTPAQDESMADSMMMMSDTQQQTPEDAAQKKAAQAFADKASQAMAPKVSTKTVALTPLTPRERVVQLLDRFTYGARPGEVDRVMAQGGGAWLEQQMKPETIKDSAMDGRMKAYPALALSPNDIGMTFPFNSQVNQVYEGKVPYPADPLLNAVYEVQVYKYDLDRDRKDADGKVIPKRELTPEETAAKSKASKAVALRVYGELLALPKEQRMAALIAMPIEDRVAFTGSIAGEQKNFFYADLQPRERDAFDAMAAGAGQSSYRIIQQQSEARMVRDILSERQLEQVMTNFWFNHFNIYEDKDSDRWYGPTYEREAIRKHALGTFKELLMATAQSPAMMVYLDNYLSIGPDSMANGVYVDKPESKRGAKGLNENYGREVMELHTVGVNGGYTQADVTALSAILTGWGAERTNNGGGFVFDPKRHEPGTKYWFGYRIDDDGTVTKLAPGTMPKITFGPGVVPATRVAANADSVKQGIAALNILADSPQTAHFISTLLAQYFVADNPPASLVDKLTKTYLASGGDIKTMIRTIAASPEFNSKQYFHNKVKTPEEFIASSLRTTATEPKQPGLLVNTVKDMGERLYFALPPTGYYLTADQWMNSVALVSRLNFAYALTNNKFGGQPFDAPKLLAMALMTPSGSSEISGMGGAKAVAAPAVAAKDPNAKLIAFATTAKPADVLKPAAVPSGTMVTLHVLEQTMVGAPVSAQTNQLIAKQVEMEPAGATAMDTLNLLTALVMGSPEFQTR